MADCKKYTSPVPTDYQEVEYIQSSGNGEYIDTGYVPTVNTRFNIDFQFIEATNPYYASIPIMGERVGTTSASKSKLALWINKTSFKEAFNFGSYDSGYDTSDITNANVRNVTSNVRANMYYNGAFVRGDDNAEFTTGNLSIYLFALNSSGTPDNRNCVVKLYRYKLYENDALVRDFIPVYRKSDNVAGLYDTINDVFYTNQGTGSFTVGANISPWQHSLRKLTTATDTITTLPADVYTDGTNATVGLVGNMSQTGTPTPQNPIQPQETGERTANLCSSTDKSQTAYLRFYIKEFKEIVDDYDTFSLSFRTDVSLQSNTLYLHTTGNEQIAIVSGTGKVTKTFTLTSTQISNIKNATEPYIYIYKSNADFSNSTEEMLNVGETPLPYQPYGYKLDIKSANTTTTVYLGEVQSTRRVKKYVCTGDESWGVSSGQGKTRAVANFTTSMGIEPLSKVLSTHYIGKEGGASYPNINTITVNNNGTMIIGISSEFTGSGAWKSYLAQQYAAGTPVTIWYVLDNPETAVVNEPLRKIGEYVDTVGGITIPTITGKDTFDVLTTLKPSEVSLTYTGWHNATVKEWDGSQWNE